ncbi:MAG: lysine 5,6-aminomutase subunit alpha [Actinomycetota bacterium]|nr:lysine 5,6-aminomutase subunit alpha [Actinomycetota bacterium]
MKKLGLDDALVQEARDLATRICRPVEDLIARHTTVAVERAVLRLCGLDGAVGEGIDARPYANLVVDRVHEQVGLERGVAIPVFDAIERGQGSLREVGAAAAVGEIDFRWPDRLEPVRASAAAAARDADAKIVTRRREREELIRRLGDPRKPWIYLIVATGNIHEDIPQAQAAARAGADIIAVIRSTGQSLLDYVPEGATTEGFAGTFATRENFRLMRAALDEVSEEVGRYIRLTNYASGLCMPEIAALAAHERLDMMLNDCMYGIIFRDINPQRTFIDQRFSRMIHARAGIIINTGEDNYLTTADAVEEAHTVVASQLINERFGLDAGLEPWQLGLGHAFEIDPSLDDAWLLELAHAQLVRELFPDSPLKYMPPTKHMTGDVFMGFLLDGMFHLTGVLTQQEILLIGMMTEGIHTPFLSDRDLAVQNASYMVRTARGVADEWWPPQDGRIRERAMEVLGEAVELLRRTADVGMFEAIRNAEFADTSRTPDGGHGLDGVIERADDYFNPFLELWDDGRNVQP